MNGGITSGGGIARRAATWVGALVAGAFMRVTVLLGANIVMARLMLPEDFGLAGLANSIAILLAVLTGGMPFAEVLAQRKVLKRQHLETATAVSFAGSALALALMALAALAIGPVFGDARFWPLLLVASLVVFPQTVQTILVAYLRRRRAFQAMARANLAGALAGSAVAVALAFLGAGPWAIVVMRCVMLVVEAGVLVATARLLVVPRFSGARLAEMRHYSMFTFMQRVATESAYFVINYTVAAFFSVAAVGQFNMALRLTEPLRGLFRGIAHNTAFEFMRAKAQDQADFPARFALIISVATATIAPVFLGLAAISGALFAIVAGPGWDEAAEIAVFIAIGTSVLLPFDLVATAFNARSVPAYLVGQRVIGLGALVLGLGVAVTLGFAGIGAGLARLVADLAESLWAARAMLTRLHVSLRGAVTGFLVPWGAAAVMGLAVALFLDALGGEAAGALAMFAAVGLGVALYLALAAVLMPQLRRAGVDAVRRRG
ncbi:oligosaccharide flippase family protein [Acuticoccus sp. I52.16.1]|uniref:oligosaccharide flippase family protein n=1 Tax=Acuticoccus sp. I52.16.1 TaxID=2928472 RepID=UPI001FCFDD9F|nr:oligosaccharide flippase family protein [Acuticoccus sp. I52.16.1]UOM37193.1 oligosaccharide flippase family protein [Acuticoccus sp. I52.16.1]